MLTLLSHDIVTCFYAANFNLRIARCARDNALLSAPALAYDRSLIPLTTLHLQMTSPKESIVQFTPFSSIVQPAFWHEVTRIKIDVLRLSEEAIPLTATYALGRTVKDRETGKELWMGVVEQFPIDVGGCREDVNGVEKGWRGV